MRCLRTLNLLLLLAPVLSYLILGSGCAQVGMPTGGPKDTIPPRLLSTLPPENTINFSGNKILLEFNEYVELKDVQKYLQISPYPKNSPVVSNKLKTITVKLKDSLLPNTTYALHFGESITDLNEGNPFKDYTYIFSTGPSLDSLELSGKVILAETGMVDSTLLVLLHRNASDSAIEKNRPNYVTTVKRDGSFRFSHLPQGYYRVYALQDNDGGKTYNAPTETFGFFSDEINLSSSTPPVSILAYAVEKDKEKEKPASPRIPAKQVNALSYTSSLTLKTQPLRKELELYCSSPLAPASLDSIRLTDTSGKRITGYRIELDSTQKTVRIQNNWLPGFPYRLIIPKNALRDSVGRTTLKTDTIAFKAKSESDYGKLTIRFKNFSDKINPVIQFWQAQKLYVQYAVNKPVWTEELFEPGEYAIRILYDENKNGRWDPGDYKRKKQPEKVIASDKKLNVKAEWDNELELDL